MGRAGIFILYIGTDAVDLIGAVAPVGAFDITSLVVLYFSEISNFLQCAKVSAENNKWSTVANKQLFLLFIFGRVFCSCTSCCFLYMCGSEIYNHYNFMHLLFYYSPDF